MSRCCGEGKGRLPGALILAVFLRTQKREEESCKCVTVSEEFVGADSEVTERRGQDIGVSWEFEENGRRWGHR